MSYRPQTGSIPHRAIEHMRSLGAEIALRPLADAIDSDAQTLRMCLMPAIAAGIIVKKMRDGLCWLSVGGGEPVSTEPEPLPVVQRVVPMRADDVGVVRPTRPTEPAPAADPHETPTEVVASAQASDPVPRRAKSPSTPKAKAEVAAGLIGERAAMYTTGELGFESECGQVMVFTKARASTLIAFFKRMAGDAT